MRPVAGGTTAAVLCFDGCSRNLFLEQAPGHIAEIQITLVALEDGDFELHIRDNTDFFDSFSAQADRLGGKGALDIEAVGMQVIRQQAKEFSYQQYESFSTLVVRI